MPDIFATPGVHAEKFDQVAGGVIPVVKIETPTTALPTTGTVADSTGQSFNPDDCAHTYGYSAGLLVTDTATDGASTWVKTYSYTSGNLTGETKWVKQ